MTTHTAGSDRELVLTRLIDAPREKLFRAWTDPELLKQWFAPLPYTTPRIRPLSTRTCGHGGGTRGQWVRSDLGSPICGHLGH